MTGLPYSDGWLIFLPCGRDRGCFPRRCFDEVGVGKKAAGMGPCPMPQAGNGSPASRAKCASPRAKWRTVLLTTTSAHSSSNDIRSTASTQKFDDGSAGLDLAELLLERVKCHLCVRAKFSRSASRYILY